MIASISSFDMFIEQGLFALRTAFGVEVFSWLTELGGAVVVALVMIAACIVLWKGKRWAYAVGLMISLAGSVAVAYLIKNLVARPRPPLEFHAIVESGFSFPSIHATAAMALYGFLAFAVCRLAPKHRVLHLTLFSLIILVVGMSRLYLGVHYPSDVIAGFVIGGLFAWIGSLVARKLDWA